MDNKIAGVFDRSIEGGIAFFIFSAYLVGYFIEKIIENYEKKPLAK